MSDLPSDPHDGTSCSTPHIVYFSSVSENTKRFVDKLPFPHSRIPLRSHEAPLVINHDYILVTPTYGGGRDRHAVPKQVMTFLSRYEHRVHCIGVIGGGNKNFGQHYILAARLLAEKLMVPLLSDFEVFGTSEEVDSATAAINTWWQKNNHINHTSTLTSQ